MISGSEMVSFFSREATRWITASSKTVLVDDRIKEKRGQGGRAVERLLGLASQPGPQDFGKFPHRGGAAGHQDRWPRARTWHAAFSRNGGQSDHATLTRTDPAQGRCKSLHIRVGVVKRK